MSAVKDAKAAMTFFEGLAEAPASATELADAEQAVRYYSRRLSAWERPSYDTPPAGLTARVEYQRRMAQRIGVLA